MRVEVAWPAWAVCYFPRRRKQPETNMTRFLQSVILCVLMGFSPAILHAATGDLLWTGQIGGDKATWSSPVISGSLVIVKGQDGGLTALNTATGLQAWYNGTIASSVTSPILQDGVLYLGADTHLYRIDPATGAVLTDRTLDGSVVSNAPAALGAHLYFVKIKDSAYSLVAVSSATLADIWTQSLFEAGTVLTDGTNIYSLSSILQALNPATGAQRWSVSPPTGFNRIYEGALNGGYLAAVIYSTFTGRTGLACWYVGDGQNAPNLIWHVDLGGNAYADGIPPAIDGSRVFLATSDGYLRAFSLASGGSLWDYAIRESGFSAPRPVALDDKVYIQKMLGADNQAVCLNAATGAVLWATGGTSGTVWGEAAVGGGKVYLAADWSGVFAFETAVHANTWPMHKNNPAQTSASGDAPPPPPVVTQGQNLLLLLDQ